MIRTIHRICKALPFATSLLVCSTIIATASTVAPAIPNAPQTSEWLSSYNRINEQMVQRGLAKSTRQDAGSILDANALLLPGDRDPLDVIARRTRALLANLRKTDRTGRMASLERQLDQLLLGGQPAGLGKSVAVTEPSRMETFAKISALQRTAAIANPLVDFDSILFVGITPQGGHMCDQYYAWEASSNCGLYIVSGFKNSPTTPVVVTDILKNVTVQKGAMAGKSLAGGAFLSPDLSYDGKTVVFAWSPMTGSKCYHLFKVGINGSNLTQLTSGVSPQNGLRYMDMSQNDFDPCWLPNGRIVFISERRGGYLRCSGDRACPTYTLYSMKDDGTDIVPISYHETNEWHPSVNNDGMLVYTRWDYVDRDDCIAHHLWTCYPDGRDPRAPHGNYPLPYSTMSGTWSNGKINRPNGEWNIRAIPGSGKYVATAGPHHGESFGQLIMIDPSIVDDGAMSQIKGITTSQTTFQDVGGPYGTAWPLSEDYFLYNHDNAIVLGDRFGNEQVILSSSATINNKRPIDPIPVKARTKPAVLANATWQGERSSLPDHKRATISIVNVNISDRPFPAGRKITAMRIIQVIPQLQQVMNAPRIGYAGESLARLSLGTVPVESDGSVFCEAPVGKEVYFQLLDEKGMAVQSMRSGTYAHAGEQLSCTGCHENKWESIKPPTTTPLAFRRAPSKLTPEAGATAKGITPINYYSLVKPVFDSKCAPCHASQGKGPADMSYWNLEDYLFFWPSNNNSYLNADLTSAIRGGSRTIPGSFGASWSRMGKALLNATHQAANITPDQYKRVILWLDGNSNELSAYTRVDDQKAGKFVWPELDMDTLNPTGVESSFPLPNSTSAFRDLMGDAMNPEIGRSLDFRIQGAMVSLRNSSGSIARIRVYDMLGHAVGSVSGHNGSAPVIFNLRTFARAQGTYIIRAFDASNTCLGTIKTALHGISAKSTEGL